MAKTFIHKYELVIGNPTNLLKKTQNTDTATPAPTSLTAVDNSDVVVGTGADSGSQDYATVTLDATTFTELQVEAVIKYNTSPTGKNAQPAVIKIYNLSDTNMNLITAQSSVILKAGYLEDKALPTVYIGQVVKVSTERSGQDIVTTLACSDGANVLKNTKHSKTYPKGDTYSSILTDLISEFASRGMPEGDFIENERTAKVIPRAIIRSGLIADSMSAVCNEIDYGWYISLGKIYVQPKEVDALTDTITIDEVNVKGRIGVLDDKSTTGSFSKESKPQGIKVTTFLNGNITTGVTLKVSYGQFAGDYKISSVSHKLNFRGSDWDTTIECQRLSK